MEVADDGLLELGQGLHWWIVCAGFWRVLVSYYNVI